MNAHELACSQPSPQQAEIILHLPPDLFWFRGHFAVQPILPGVAQLDWAMRYASQLLTPDYRFHSIQSVKYQSPLLPDNIVTLSLHWQAEKELLNFSYQRHAGNERHNASHGKIRLCR